MEFSIFKKTPFTAHTHKALPKEEQHISFRINSSLVSTIVTLSRPAQGWEKEKIPKPATPSNFTIQPRGMPVGVHSCRREVKQDNCFYCANL